MNTIIKSILTLGLAAGLGFAANAQKTATANATANVLADLTIDLDGTQNAIAFGTLSASTPGAVVLEANGTANANTGSVTNVARFDLAGANAGVTVSYDATVTLSNSDPTPATMTMTPDVKGAALDTDQAAKLSWLVLLLCIFYGSVVQSLHLAVKQQDYIQAYSTSTLNTINFKKAGRILCRLNLLSSYETSTTCYFRLPLLLLLILS